VEYVVTYYHPKRNYLNVIIDTFVDACSRIIDHLGNLKGTKGSLLLLEDDRKTYIPAGIIEGDRYLYHKPGTNLYYMDIYDHPDLLKVQSIGDVDFIPQMTFRCRARDVIEIIQQMVTTNAEFTVGKSLMAAEAADLEDLVFTGSIVDGIFEKYNETAKTPIDFKSSTGKTIKAYVFFILYKVYMFISYRNLILSKKDYLKDHLTFSSRHPNYELYKRIKEILKKEYKITDTAEILKLLYHPDLIQKMYSGEGEEDQDDYTEDGDYLYNYDAYKDQLPTTDKNFGNPLFSMHSYFKHMEVKSSDWLKEAKHDNYSTTFDLTGDIVLTEARSFRYWINLYLKNKMNPKINSDGILSVRNMHEVVYAFYGDKIRGMMNLKKHDTNKRLTRKKVAAVSAKPVTAKIQFGLHPKIAKKMAKKTAKVEKMAKAKAWPAAARSTSKSRSAPKELEKLSSEKDMMVA
jgi:hypothetical protein